VSQLFADGFEAGNYSAWTSTTVTGTATLAVSAAAALTGTRGSRSTYSTAGDNNYEAKATRVFTPPTTGRLFAIASVRLTTVAAVGYGVVGSKAVMAVRAQDGQEQAWFSLRDGGLRFSYRSRSGSVVAVNSSIPLNTATTAFLRILIDRTGVSPMVQGWISTNGIDWMDVGAATDASAGTQGIAKPSGQLDVGVVHIANFEPGNYTIDCDGVQILDSLDVTDWRILSALVQPVAFAHGVSVERGSTAAVTARLSASAQGARDALAAPYASFDLRTASTSLREALTTSSETVSIRQDNGATVDRRAMLDTDFGLVSDMSGTKDWQQHVETDFALRATQHARMGEIVQPVMVSVSDRDWGTVSVMDSEA
jgi:hypothetical protein